MKRPSPRRRTAAVAVRTALLLSGLAFVPLLLRGGAPPWWSQRGVLLENAARDDYGPANHGQLKNIVNAAAAEMDAKLPGGAGDVIHLLIQNWSTPSTQKSDFASVNIGQLKQLAKPFYDRLIAAKYSTGYPWTGAARMPHDFAVANVGQIKQLFSFDFTATDLEHDADQDGLPDWWEKYYFGDLTVDPGALAPRGDGLTNIQCFQQGLDPFRRSPQFLSIKPDRIDQTLAGGQVATKTVTISNSGPVPRRVMVAAHDNTTVKLGYSDSDQPDGPQFVWDDVSTTGVHLDNVSDADDGFEAFPISFAFPYFGNSYSTLYVVSNGFVTLQPGSNFSRHRLLPNADAPPNLIAPFFNDLDLGASGDVYYRDYGDRVVIQFENAARWEGDGFATFQVVLHQNGLIRFYYKDMEGTLDDAVIGIQNMTGDKGITVAFNRPYLKDNFAIEITQSGLWLEESPADLFVQPGGTANFLVTLDGRGLGLGSFHAGLSATTDAPSDVPFELPVTMTIVDEGMLDDDGDSLSNAQERALGTNPTSADTDGDGMPDGWEVANHLNPLTNDASADPDGDGFTNLQEYQNFTNPFEYTAPATFIDKFDDWSHIESQSGNWQLDNTTPEIFDGDTSRAVRLSATTSSLDYWVPALISVDATIYYQGVLQPDQVRFFTSLDNYTWSEVNVARIADSPEAGGWRRAVISRNSAFPQANYYFRIEISGTELASNPQLSEIKFVHNDLNPPIASSQNITTVSSTATAVRLSATDADGDAVGYRITEQPAHGTLTGSPPDIIYTAAADYVGFDRITFVASDGTRDSYPVTIFVNVTAPPPPAPADLTFTQTSSSSAQLTWSGPGASSYIIERSTDGGLTWQQIGEVNSATTSFTDSTYASGTFYSYRVRAKGQTASVSQPSIQISSKGTNPATADSDGDGVVDNIEAQHHSNPDNKDTDGDGVPDGEDGAPSDPTRWTKPIERHYAVIDLGVLPGATESWPIAMNNAGHVLCASGDGRYFVWINGERKQLPHKFMPYGLNDNDIVVGDTSYLYSPLSQIVTNGAYWSNGQLIRLPQLMVGRPGFPKSQTYTSSVAAINNVGEIVGWSSSDGSGLFATKWVGAGAQLPAQSSFKVLPFAISDSGAVIAAAETDSGYDVILLPATRLGASRDHLVLYKGVEINSAGVIVTRGRLIWPPGTAGSAPKDINSLLAPESATTIDFSHDVTNANEILADAHDGTGDYDLVIFRLATATSPPQLYKVVDSEPRISWLAPVGMNDKGQIAATANYNDGSPAHAVLLVPAELMVDGNRDGEMSFDDPSISTLDRTSEEKPYRFWVNDDDDGAAGDPNDHVPPRAPDYADGTIQSIRDLEDFARLHVNIGGLEAALESNIVQAAFEWRQTTNNPRIKLYRATSAGTSYLTDESAANSALLYPFRDTLGEVAPGVPLFMPAGFWVTNSGFTNVPKTLPRAWLLFEGSGEGKGALVLTFWKDGRKIGETAPVWLELKNVKRMFQRAKAIPLNGVAAPWSDESPLPTAYEDDPNGYEFDMPPDESHDAIIFVHGIHPPLFTSDDSYLSNVNTAETVYKRLWHEGYKGRFAFYKWPALNPAGYFLNGSGFEFNQSEYRAFKYGKGLAAFAATLPATYNKHVYAHSQGNAVAAAAFRNYGLKARTWIVTQGAIPISCFDVDLRHYVFNYITPDSASDLGYRGFLDDRVQTRIVNFCNSQDTVTGKIWELNHELFKPTVHLDGLTRIEYWFFSDPSEVHLKRFFNDVQLSDRAVNDPHESMAMAVKSRSRAIAHGTDVQGKLDETVDLHAMFGFGDEHGSQWERPIQRECLRYFEKLTDEIR